jgi:hypothetical protein
MPHIAGEDDIQALRALLPPQPVEDEEYVVSILESFIVQVSMAKVA